jgi:cell pole-organizing protein PopZ
MVDKNSEMSLDDVLSSIKKMVIDNEPPVLDLTDVVKPDGSVVKIKQNDPEGADIGSFLKLAQENADLVLENKYKKEEFIAQQLKEAPIVSVGVSSCPITSNTKQKSSDFAESSDKKSEAIMELIKEIMIPLINKWMDDNLPNIAKKVVEEKFREVFRRSSGE